MSRICAVMVSLLMACNGESETDGPASLEAGVDGPLAADGTQKADGPTDGSLGHDGPGSDGYLPDGPSPSCGAVVTFADGKQPTKVLHVAKGGSDTTGDGSVAKPFASIKKAAGMASPGTAVRVHAGTYSGGIYLSGLSGTAAAPIWIGGAPGEAPPVLDGGGDGLHLTKVRYLVVHDIEVRNSSNNGINCDDGGERGDPDATRHVVFRKLDIHDIGGGGNQDCLKLSGLDDYFVFDSSFSKCGGSLKGSGIDHVGCHKGVIVGNTFKNLSGNGVQCKGGSEEIEIRANWFDEPGDRGVNMGGSTGDQYFRPPLSTSTPNVEARNIRVIANVIKGGTAALGFVGCVDCIAAHNTIITPHKWLLRVLQEKNSGGGYTFLPCSNGQVINNLFYYDRSELSSYEDVNVGPNTQVATFSFANNLWYAYDNPGSSTPKLPVSETGGVVGQDPLFAGASSGDYSIKAGSPAAGKGKVVVGIKGDYTGSCYKSPPAIGAFAAP